MLPFYSLLVAGLYLCAQVTATADSDSVDPADIAARLRDPVAPTLKAVLKARATTTSSSASTSSTPSAEPIAPRNDPWYAEPLGFERSEPGTILRIRPAPGNLTAITSNCSAAYNILYRTTSSLYRPTWAVTTLFVPQNYSGALLSFQTPYDSVDLNASPSYAMYAGVYTDVPSSLGKGWLVSVPDYEGPLASFTAGVISGHATIDGVRAALAAAEYLRLLPTGSRAADLPYALWGYSGGALASEWAAELQVQYAPELSFSGVAVGGLTPNITSVLLTISDSIMAGLAVSSIIGTCNQYPDILSGVLSTLNQNGTDNSTGFLASLDMDLSESISAYAFKNISAYFTGGLSDILNPTTEKLIYRDGIMGYHGVPQAPIFAYKAVADEVSPIADTDTLIERYCSMGANILYHRNTVGGHSAEGTNGHAAAVAFLDSVLNGTYTATYNTTGCTVQNVAVNVSTSAY